MICTPTQTHPGLVQKCLHAGYLVFCEKPVALSLSDMDECYRLSQKNNAPLLCGFHRRFDPSFVMLKDAVDTGKVGAISVIRKNSPNYNGVQLSPPHIPLMSIRPSVRHISEEQNRFLQQLTKNISELSFATMNSYTSPK